jgi:hypothetical protein
MRKRREGERLPPFVPVFVETLKCPAWRAMSHGARNLYIALKARYGVKAGNNGRLFLSQRDAQKELGSGRNEIANWYRELQHYGFIVQTDPGGLGVEGRGRAPHWRLTELPCKGSLPTKDYLRWDGTKFRRHRLPSRIRKKTESRTGNQVHTGPEITPTSGTEITSSSNEEWPGNQVHKEPTTGGSEIRSISRLATRGGAGGH